MTRYSKFLAALATAISGIAAFLADGEVSQNDIIGSAALIVGAVAVLLVRNTPTTPEV